MSFSATYVAVIVVGDSRISVQSAASGAGSGRQEHQISK
jgi:hypothetical protein